MIKNIKVINQHTQVMELANQLKFNILRELISSAATCQQLATVLGVSKQKVHYNLTQLLEKELIEIVEDVPNNGKEIYYRATAKNYILDFALGEHIGEDTIHERRVIQTILQNEYNLSLSSIAAKILKQSLKLRPRQKLLIVTGKYNMPLVEKILLEAGRHNIRTTLIYQDAEMLREKYEEYSLAAFNADYEHFNRLLKNHDAYLNLNGETRNIQLLDPDKLKLRVGHFARSNEIIRNKKIRVGMMPGLLHETLSDKAIESELQFWKALDVDYEYLAQETLSICEQYKDKKSIEIKSKDYRLQFIIQGIVADTGSFTESPYQSFTINYPGGEVLFVPAEGTMNGEVHGDVAYAYGQTIMKPKLVIQNNEVKNFSAETNEQLLAKALLQGGIDGRKVALVTMGTNPNVSLANIDVSFKQKSRGLLSLYWGENQSLGGKVSGTFEWFLQLENPQIISKP